MNASSVVLNYTKLWVFGGEGEGVDHFKSTEFISLDSPSVKGPDLPFKVIKHCTIKYNEDSIYLIGGYQDGIISEKTWIIGGDPDKNGFTIKEGPCLNTKRYAHSCGIMEKNGKILIVVAGGQEEDDDLDTVEILDPSSNAGWILGNFRH